jgi:hypothetical protein
MSQKITRNQRKAVAALLKYKTIGEAAEAVRINPRTLHRWLDDPGFRLELSQAEGEAIDLITRRLLVMGDKALDSLEDVLDCPDQPGASNRRLAALAILDQLLKLRELRNIEGRLTDLEKEVF